MQGLPSIRQKHIKCFTCGGLGHRSAECPGKRQGGEALPEVPDAGQLPASKSKAGDQLRGPVCFRCRQRGHLKADCPLPEKVDGQAAPPAQTPLGTATDAGITSSERSAKHARGSGRDSSTAAGEEQEQVDKQIQAWSQVNNIC